jgi:small neutral amino acid transporter SnatA (MarC family)
MGLFAQFAFVIPDRPFEMLIGFASIVGGALLWWYGLTWLVNKIRTIFKEDGIRIINQIIGAVVTVFSIIYLFGTVSNLFTFF